MNWKFWNREEKDDYYADDAEYEVETENLPLSTLFRWYCYDTGVENPNQFAVDFGISPISEEGEQFEKRESAQRLMRLIPYLPFLDVMSDINAMVLSQTLTNILTKYDIELDADLEEEQEIMEDIYKHISLGCLTSAFSAALSLGIIINPGSFVTGGTNNEFE